MCCRACRTDRAMEKPPALVPGKPAQAVADGQLGPCLPALIAGAGPGAPGPGPPPALAPQNGRAVPLGCGTALQTQGCSQRPLVDSSPSLHYTFLKFGMTQVLFHHCNDAYGTVLHCLQDICRGIRLWASDFRHRFSLRTNFLGAKASPIVFPTHTSWPTDARSLGAMSTSVVSDKGRSLNTAGRGPEDRYSNTLHPPIPSVAASAPNSMKPEGRPGNGKRWWGRIPIPRFSDGGNRTV